MTRRKKILKYVYTILIGFVFWNFGYLVYSTLYGMLIVFGAPDSPLLNNIVKIVWAPPALYLGYKIVIQEIARRNQRKKEISKKKSPQKQLKNE